MGGWMDEERDMLKKNGEKDASANILKRFREGAGEMLERSEMTKSATKKPTKKSS